MSAVPVATRENMEDLMSSVPLPSVFMEIESETPDVGWCNLPHVVLVKIYTYLNDSERANMVRVCKNWSPAFDAPSLWRRRRYEMGGYRARIAEQQASGFAEMFGRHLRFLTITCNHPSLVTCKIFQRAMESFLPKLQRRAKLKEFRFSRLEMDRYWRYDNLKDKLVETLTRFLRQQISLRLLDLSHSQFYLSAGLKVLEAAGLSSGPIIRKLCVEDLFHSRLTVYSGLRYKRAISRFVNLRNLSLNYGYLSDDIMKIFTENLAGKLKSMAIRVYRSDPHSHRLSKYSWSSLRKACPGLKVKINFESIGFASDITRVLVSDIPLQELYIWTGFDDNVDWRLWTILEHIGTYFRSSLEICNLEFDNSSELIDEALLRMIQKCQGLKSLVINAVICVETIDSICSLLQQGKIDLRTLHITACNLGELEWAELAFIQETYSQLAQQRQMDLRINSDLVIETMPPAEF